MSKLRVLVVHSDTAELDRLSNLLEKGSHAVLPLETITDAAEALGLQRFDAVLLAEDTPADDLARFASNIRRILNDARGETRPAILTWSNSVADPKITVSGSQTGYFDAMLPTHFEPSLFAKTVEQLSVRLSQCSLGAAQEERAVFEIDEFKSLLGNSPELLEEIITLFLEESGLQLKQMDDCLASANYDSLAKIAHTLKGSLGTLHAHRARADAQALEIAATRQEKEDCRVNLDRLYADLDELRPLLIELRSGL
jgi:HPt (histidine-containing phosphotransfer) domain-containing protein/CheY-like chemotaxis protein